MRNSTKLKWSFFVLAAISISVGLSLSKKKDLGEARALNPNETKAVFQGGIRILNKAGSIDERKVFLGRELFLEKQLSKNNTISCNDCHDLNHGGVDGRKFSVGINGQVGSANSPTVFNSVFNFKQFWDGRAESLSDQVEGPVHNPLEMGSTWEDVVQKLGKNPHYLEQFQKIYGSTSPTATHIKDAIVEFEKSLITLNSPFDQYLGGKKDALNDFQISGYKKFSSYGCISCHQGQNIGGNMFQTLGITADYFKDRGGFYPSDLGRYNITKLESDLHVFKVPSLRNVALTAPYFHDGSAETLAEAIRKMAKYQLGRRLSDADVRDLEAFLNSLTGEIPDSVKTIQRGVSNEK